ncbi:uncharacterized protein LOC127789621 [Diospyros lotus]|uniref:uncharacterized protein LOC127789621 n=1 Tax=Diospyros lotus TaxID=55363 RepID=UPI00224C94DF|nr:uncharacterized protein LOC127789621 [Diospyros lotus]
MDSWWLQLHRLLSDFYLSLTIPKFRCLFAPLSHIKRFPFAVTLADAIISAYFRLCGLSPVTVDLDDQTTMHFWAATHRRFDKPALVLIHGYGSTAPWQFFRQVGPLSRSFNLFIPDLIFFGNSHSKRSDRSEVFQARCVVEGLRSLGVARCSLYALSYGGWVGYRAAEMFPEMVEKVVIVSSGVGGCTEEQRREGLQKIGVKKFTEMLCPKKPADLRSLAAVTMHKFSVAKLLPDFFIREFITVMHTKHSKERLELVEHLLERKAAESDLPVLTQETLLVWGDQDRVFPLFFAYQLQRHLGAKSKLEIIRDTGHAVNMEAPALLNDLIKWFVLGDSKLDV